MTAVKWTKTWCFQQSVSFFQAELMFAFTVVGPAALQNEFYHHLIWNSSHRAFTWNKVMANSTAPVYKKLNKDKRVETLPKIIPGHQWHLGAAEVGKTWTKAPPYRSSAAVQTRGSGCWQKTPRQGEWIPEATFNSYTYYIYNWKKKNKNNQLPKAEIGVKPYLVVHPTSSTSELPKFLVLVIRSCTHTPAALEGHRDPVQVEDTQA